MEDWTVDQVCEMLLSIGLTSQVDAFQTKKVDGAKLVTLTKEDLQNMGFTPLQAKKVLQGVEKQQTKESSSPIVVVKESVLPAPSTSITNSTLTETNQTMTRERTVYKMSNAFGYETRIEGFETQMVTIDLGPGHAVQSEPGPHLHDGWN